MKTESGYIESGIIDDRTAREVSAEVWNAVWFILDDCHDLSVSNRGPHCTDRRRFD